MNSAVLQACLSQYGDILRAGRMTVNGSAVEWKPTSCVDPMTSLISLRTAMEECPDLPGDWSPDVDELLYCIMKSLSFQFALMDVLEALQAEFGLATLPTIPSEGLRYAVQLSETACEAQVLWPRKAKIFTVDMDTGERATYASIESVCTAFEFPVASDSTQAYRVGMRVPQRLLGVFQTKVAKRITLLTDSPLLRRTSAPGREVASGASGGSGLSREMSDVHARPKCANGCGRPAARDFPDCCRTCCLSDRTRHGPMCEERTARWGGGDVSGGGAGDHGGVTSPSHASTADFDEGVAEEFVPVLLGVTSRSTFQLGR